MLKATLRSAVLLGLLVWSVPSFAEVQNVKVGGDVTVRAFFRKNLDLHDEGKAADTSGADATGLEGEHFLMSTVGLNIGADLTENVSAFIRLASERDWNVGTHSASNATADFALSQGYVTLKELFYSPLTLRIGQQPIVWGRGFVLGSNLLPGTVLGGNQDLHGSITANEFTDFTAFDAIRGTLDLSGVAGLGMPLTLDTVYIKMNENSVNAANDVNLMGFNLGTHFDQAHSEAETYYLVKRDKNTHKTGTVNTIGVRGSAKPVSGSNVYGELGYQFGDRATDLSGTLPSGESQQAWAFDLGADYTFADVVTKPKLGAEWIFHSGKDVNGAVAGWDPIAPGYFTTAIRDFQTGGVAGFYPVDQTCVHGGSGTACTSAVTNQHQLSLYGSLTPLEDLTVNERLSWFVLDKGAIPVAGSKRRNFAGTEWDTVVNYNYTDDVQLGVIYALFAPGSIYRSPNNDTAQELITSVSVKF